MVFTGTGQALNILGAQKEQLYKLTSTGILRDHRAVGARNRKLKASKVAKIAAWEPLVLPNDEHAIIVHLTTMQPAEPGDTRPMMGFHVNNEFNLSDGDRELAWVGNWPFSDIEASAAVGKILLGDVSGWIPRGMGRRIAGYVRLPDGRVRFEVAPLTKGELKKYTKKRIKALPGQIWQRA